jgi:ribosomal protein S18 acetylase RimI-like enzyme
MISVSLQTRPAEPADQQQIASLMSFEAHVHRHMDWRTPLDWLGSPHYWVLEDQQRVMAALACSQDPPGIAWLRLFTFAPPLSGLEAWSPLWAAARDEMACAGGALAAAIAAKPWMQELLRESGFHFYQEIVLLEWTARPIDPCPPPDGISIRTMSVDDLSCVVETDVDAFEPLWHNSVHALRKAYSLAVCATVAEKAGRVIGYQISTGNLLGAHLARLAVRKEAQGKGVGSALLNDLILRLSSRYLARLTVNTQANNIASLALYQKLGFVRTGEQYPVFIYQV